MPLEALRLGAAVSSEGKAVGDVEGAVLGAMLEGNGVLTRLELGGSACSARALELIAEGVRASGAPLTVLKIGGLHYSVDGESVADELDSERGLRAVVALASSSLALQSLTLENWAIPVADQGDV
eukprot:2804358-Prymnesium_polylepis.1